VFKISGNPKEPPAATELIYHGIS